MDGDERDHTGLPPDEMELVRSLVRLGPSIRAQERAEAEIDASFVWSLRARLVSEEYCVPRVTPPVSRRSRLAVTATILVAAGVSVAILLGRRSAHSVRA